MTLKALYQAITGDPKPHPRSIAARVRKLDARRRRILHRRAAGASLATIAAEEGVTKGSIQSAINTAMCAIRKAINGQPRYHVVGRAKKRPAKTTADRPERTSQPGSKPGLHAAPPKRPPRKERQR